MKDNTTFKNNVYDFIDERLNESWTKLNKDKEYKEKQYKYRKSLEELEEKLSDNIILVEDHTENEVELYTMQLHEAYKTGFRDSVQILMEADL